MTTIIFIITTVVAISLLIFWVTRKNKVSKSDGKLNDYNNDPKYYSEKDRPK